MTELEQMVLDCSKRSKRLNNWERMFLEDVAKRVKEAKPLTPNQRQKLDDIWEKATADG